MSPSDPGWVGAWWIGLIYSGLAAMTVAALMACFPYELPSMLKHTHKLILQKKLQELIIFVVMAYI